MAPKKKTNKKTEASVSTPTTSTTPATTPATTPTTTPTTTRATTPTTTPTTTRPTTPTTTPTTSPVTTPTTTPTTTRATTPTTTQTTTPGTTPTATPTTTPTIPPTTTPTRVTRSATRRGDASLQKPVDNPEPRKRKKVEAAAIRTVIIGYSKQSKSFKTKAIEVKNGLEKELSEINVVLNPEKPKKGCFQIREEGGEIFVSLLDMEKPLTPLKELDVQKVISDIIDKIR